MSSPLEIAVPKSGDVLPTGEVVMTVNTSRWNDALEELGQIQPILQTIIKEYSDLGVGEIATTEHLREVLGLGSEMEAREHVAKRLLSTAGDARIGGLKLSPTALAQMIEVSELNDLLRANKAAERFFGRVYKWRSEHFEVVDGQAKPTAEAIQAVLRSCMAVASSEKAKRVFKIMQKAVKAMHDLEAEFPGASRAAACLQGLDQYMAPDIMTGETIVDGYRINQVIGN